MDFNVKCIFFCRNNQTVFNGALQNYNKYSVTLIIVIMLLIILSFKIVKIFLT